MKAERVRIINLEGIDIELPSMAWIAQNDMARSRLFFLEALRCNKYRLLSELLVAAK